jgi:DNA modification methylase
VKIEQVKLDALIPYARNSRTHSDAQVAQIAASIKEFGFTNPVLIDETGSIIAGHGRVMAARKLAIADVPSIRLTHLTEAQKKAYVIADNKLALNAGWDDEMLAVELTDLKDMGFDLDLTGFSTDEIEALLAPVGTEGLTDEDAVPEVPEAPVTVLGDVWLLGKHRVMCGDSTSIDAVEKLMWGQKANAVITDPPYNVGKNYAGENLNENDFSELHRGWLSCAAAVTKDESAYYVYFGVKHLWLMAQIISDYLNNPRLLIWYRPDGHGAGGGDFFYNYDPIFYGSKNGKFHTRKYDGEFNRDVWIINKARENEGGYQHPTAKPLKVIEGAMLTSTNIHDVVLDLFGGSGTTIIAAEKNGRYGYLMELDPKYCDVIVQRWQEFTGQTATLESTGESFIPVKKAA